MIQKLLLAVILMGSMQAVASDKVACMNYLRNNPPYPSASEAARLCQGASVECITYLRNNSPYPAATEAAGVCNNGAEVSCITYLRNNPPYPNAIEAAQQCGRRTCN